MDLDLLQTTKDKDNEIAQFLCDVRDYFKASLETSEYENTSNLFFVTASETTGQLLHRCEELLTNINGDKNNGNAVITNGLEQHSNIMKGNLKHPVQLNECCKNVLKAKAENIPTIKEQRKEEEEEEEEEVEDISYLDMTAAKAVKKTTSCMEMKNSLNNSSDSDKTFRCSTHMIKHAKAAILNGNGVATLHNQCNDFLNENHNMNNDEDDDNDDDDDDDENAQIYDICQVTTQGSDGEEDHVLQEDERHKVIRSDSDLTIPDIHCPYKDLPAGHLAIQNSSKYGQLNRIEKRLFFDQCKKYYCGILDDWFLCYADGPMAAQPSTSLYLKMPGIEIEHFGEGKRRDVCFQISTTEANKRFVFQAVNEVDAKEWIHAIEAAIRNHRNGMNLLAKASVRKLPTPPTQKKLTFLSSFQINNNNNNNNNNTKQHLINSTTDSIYEEPSPLYQMNEPSEFLIAANDEEEGEEAEQHKQPPELPTKQNSPKELAQRFDYDIPKYPAQPLKSSTEKFEKTEIVSITTASSINTPLKTHSLYCKIDNAEEKWDFQAKVKDVHNKLSSQLSAGPLNLKKTNKLSYMSANQNDANTLINNNLQQLPTTPHTTADHRKERKSYTPQNSPQKTLTLASPEKTAKNWFLNRLNKSTSSSNRQNGTNSVATSPTKSKQSEKENLLNSSSDTGEGFDSLDSHLSSNPTSPILKTTTTPIKSNGKSKVNMIINKLEASGHLATMFSVDAVTSFSCFNDKDCNNYEPIVTMSSPPSSFMKKV